MTLQLIRDASLVYSTVNLNSIDYSAKISAPISHLFPHSRPKLIPFSLMIKKLFKRLLATGMSFGVDLDALFSKMCNHTENGTGKKLYYRILLYRGDCSRDLVRKNLSVRRSDIYIEFSSKNETI